MVVSDDDDDEEFQVCNSIKHIKILMLMKIDTIYMKILWLFK